MEKNHLLQFNLGKLYKTRARLTPGVQPWAEKLKMAALALLPPLFWDLLVVEGSEREAGIQFHPLLESTPSHFPKYSRSITSQALWVGVKAFLAAGFMFQPFNK